MLKVEKLIDIDNMIDGKLKPRQNGNKMRDEKVFDKYTMFSEVQSCQAFSGRKKHSNVNLAHSP